MSTGLLHDSMGKIAYPKRDLRVLQRPIVATVALQQMPHHGLAIFFRDPALWGNKIRAVILVHRLVDHPFGIWGLAEHHHLK